MRLKVFYFLVLFGVLVIGSTLFMVKFTFQEQFQMLKDVSLGAMSIFSWLLAVLATAMLLPKDMEDRTLYTILAKPVPRFEYLLGKLLGVLALLAVAIALMSVVFVVVLYSRQQTVLAETAQTTAAARSAGSAATGARLDFQYQSRRRDRLDLPESRALRLGHPLPLDHGQLVDFHGAHVDDVLPRRPPPGDRARTVARHAQRHRPHEVFPDDGVAPLSRSRALFAGR